MTQKNTSLINGLLQLRRLYPQTASTPNFLSVFHNYHPAVQLHLPLKSTFTLLDLKDPSFKKYRISIEVALVQLGMALYQKTASLPTVPLFYQSLISI